MVKDQISTLEELLTVTDTYIKDQENIELITQAFNYAQTKHEGQKRKSGEPYLVHVASVAYILAKLKVGPKTIAAGLLHDVIEDCDVDEQEFIQLFGEEIYNLVNGVTKISKLKFKDEKEYQAENHRKIFIAMAKDVRVILIKLVDRLHNMRTLDYQDSARQQRIANETLLVYAPIAHRLGISDIKNELEDLSFYYLNRNQYYEIAKLVEKRKSERDSQVKQVINHISQILKSNNIEFKIFGRSKHLYSIYKKMTFKYKKFEEIFDLLAIRIITKSKTSCYEVLGHIHASFLPIPGRFKDYIAMPKMNLYQSLHTTIMIDGNIFEVQIRTEEMDKVAEFGVAAHWKYKEGKTDKEIDQKGVEEKLQLLKEITSVTSELQENAVDYINTITRDIFEANVYVMSPKGKIVCLVNGSTPIDFAYRIHTEVGHKMVGAIINGALAPINTVLKTGDVVQIRTSNNSQGPSEDWLKIVKTNTARNKIKSFFKEKEIEHRSSDVKKGAELLKEELVKKSFKLDDYFDVKRLEQIASSFSCNSYEDLMYHIAVKNVSIISVIEKLTRQKVNTNLDNQEVIDLYNKSNRKYKTNEFGIQVQGIDGIKVSIAACCYPVPDDLIVGYISKGQGIKVHRDICNNVKANPRIIDVEWDYDNLPNQYRSNIVIYSLDRNYLLSDIVNIISQYKASILNVNSQLNHRELSVTTKISVLIKDIEHLNLIIKNILKLPYIKNVERLIA